ncbi:SDR family oxidoreductase [Dyella jejuensis]|uniref:SDR family oxidoreductase n=1 Tax=Dyella jejuensis TaxID=1432009 RepID=A0ABW8JL58_9GAMM
MSDETISTSRRRLMQGASLGMAVAMSGAAWSAQKEEGANATDQAAAPLRDPRQGYPHPPFQEQSQPWPGLAGKMTPRPDHGETSYRGSGKLLGRRALITGGDSGIGRATAIAFAREGADVAISYLPAEEPDAKEVIELIQKAGRKALALPGDIRDETMCQNLVARVIAAFGGIDLLVNNAGRQHSFDSILDITTEYFDWTLKTNLYAMFWITKAAVAHMPPGSSIVNTASVNAYDPAVNLLDYSLTKGGIVAFTKGLAKQMIKRGIRVNGVAPGPFWTALQVSGGQTEKNIKDFGGNTPMGRPGQPAEIAHVYVQLAAAESSYVTGQIYGETGGRGEP